MKTHHELIGKEIEIVEAHNKQLVGMHGIVIDETKNMIELENGKKIAKEHITLNVNNSVIKGSSLLGRAEERLKKGSHQ
ncbi:MAG: ribonuclease P protein subunit [Candidatus Nanoarchaeia archaeon]